MLTLTQELYDAIVAHARRDHPDEACGVIAGPAGSDRPERFVPMLNAERSPTFYRFDSMEQLRVWQEMDERDEEPVVIYHSHTATEAYPSRTDIGLASEPGAHYVLVSTREPDETEFRELPDRRRRGHRGTCRDRPVRRPESPPSGSRCDNVTMAIEARIPTILRNYTGGEKAVAGSGDTLGELFTTWTPGTRGCAAGWSARTAR